MQQEIEGANQFYRSRTFSDNASPIWDEKIRILLRPGLELSLEIWDEDPLGRELLMHHPLMPLPCDGPYRAYFLNFTDPKINNAVNFTGPKIGDTVMEAFYMLRWYTRNHTLACVVPAMFIAGAIATFFSKEAVLRHLGPKANKVEAYSVASVSGTVLAVCS